MFDSLHCATQRPTAWTNDSLTHTFGMCWSETPVEYWSARCYGDDGGGSFPQTLEIYWLSIINFIMLMFLLVGFVAVILMHVLWNDRVWYNLDEAMTSGGSSDDGWRIIHSDVFCFPPCCALPCAMLGMVPREVGH